MIKRFVMARFEKLAYHQSTMFRLRILNVALTDYDRFPEDFVDGEGMHSRWRRAYHNVYASLGMHWWRARRGGIPIPDETVITARSTAADHRNTFLYNRGDRRRWYRAVSALWRIFSAINGEYDRLSPYCRPHVEASEAARGFSAHTAIS